MNDEQQSEIDQRDDTERGSDPDRMPVDLQKLMLQIPGLKLSDVIAFAEWQKPLRDRT
jgi:hypothetical protein